MKCVASCFAKIRIVSLLVLVFFGFVSTNAYAAVPSSYYNYQTAATGLSAPAQNVSSVKSMSEFKLYQTLNDSPNSISKIVFVKGSDTVEVYLTKDEKTSIYYDVVTGSSADRMQLRNLALKQKVDFVNKSNQPSAFASFVFNMLPMILIIGLMIYFFRRQQNPASSKKSNNGSGGFRIPGLSSPKIATQPNQKVTLADVAGQDEAKQEIAEVVEFLKSPGVFAEMDAKVPRGIILTGPPGTGKTLFAKAVAGEAGVGFVSRSGSEFVEMYVGVGAKRIREMVEEAKKFGKCIVFIDEIDAFARKRSSQGSVGNSEAETTLNQLLTEMDGFGSSDGIIFMAATNRLDMIDPALLRSGRFDRKVSVGLPDKTARAQIFKLYLAKKKCTDEVMAKIEHWAKITPGASGASIAGAVNEAAVIAARRIKKARLAKAVCIEMITSEDLDEGILRATWGAASESKARLMTDEIKRNLAVHEAGHAVVAMAHGDDPGRITIMPRGQTGGHYQSLSDTDGMQTYSQLIAMIDMALGGRAAQKVLLGRADTGCSNDLMQANNIATFLTTQVGMSRLGAIYVPDGVRPSAEVLAVVKELVDERQAVVEKLIEEHKTRLEAIVKALLEHETLLGFELKAIWEGFGDYRSAKVDMLPEHELTAGDIDKGTCDCDQKAGPASAIAIIGQTLAKAGKSLIPDSLPGDIQSLLHGGGEKEAPKSSDAVNLDK